MPAPLVEKRASICSVRSPKEPLSFLEVEPQAGLMRCGSCVMPLLAHIVNVIPDCQSELRSSTGPTRLGLNSPELPVRGARKRDLEAIRRGL